MAKYPALTTVGTERVIDVTKLDRPAVFLCFGQATFEAAAAVENAIHEQHTVLDVLVAHVVDLRPVPRMMRGMAERVLQSEYEKAVTLVPEHRTPYDAVVILPDWDGAFIKSLGYAEEVSKQLGVAVFAADGTLLGTAQGEAAAAQCLELLATTLP